MTHATLAFVARFLGVATLAACSKGSSTAPASGSNSASAPLAKPADERPAASAASAPIPRAAKPSCRALVVTGQVTENGAQVAVSSLLDGEHWLELAENSSVALRHTSSSREWNLIGPGHLLPCRNGSEQILLTSGRLTTSANLGVRPGAEVLIATPAGSVRYGDAALDVELGPRGLQVRVKQGEAWVEPARGSAPFGNPVRSGEARLPPQRATGRALVEACTALAEAAATSAAEVLQSGAAGSQPSLGARAAVQMRARAQARIACANAAAAAFAASDPDERLTLSASVAHADELWQSVPRASVGRKN